MHTRQKRCAVKTKVYALFVVISCPAVPCLGVEAVDERNIISMLCRYWSLSLFITIQINESKYLYVIMYFIYLWININAPVCFIYL